MAGREKELKHGDHSVHQATESPLVSATRVREARAEGLACRRTAASLFKITAIKPISYLNTLFRQGGGGLKETEPV